MTRFLANARMYAVTPEAEALWRDLLARVAAAAEVDLDYRPYPAPQDLEALWSRPDLGAVLMCGYPIAMRLAPTVPLAAPVPSLPWAKGRAVYRTDFIVRADGPFATLADTFGGRIGWTVAHSHSGFNAPRRHLLRYRTAERPTLYAQATGDLVTARKVLDSVKEGAIDVGPLDAFWHALLARHRPDLVRDIRVVESTDLAPIPAFVAAPALDAAARARLRQSFVAAGAAPWFAPFREALLIDGFAAVDRPDFDPTLAAAVEARLAGYAAPV